MTLGEFITSLGYLTGAGVLYWAARQKNLLTEGMLWVAIWAFVGGMVGAKVSEFVMEGWPLKLSPLAIFDPELGGKALLGGLVGGWLAAMIAKHRMGLRRSTGDMFALALPAGEAVGRIGCYFNGCCYGLPTSSSIAIYQHGAWRYPTQIYSSVTALSIFLILFWLRNRMPKEGDLFKFYLLLFGITRFLIEYMRARPIVVWGLSAMQFFCIELIAFGGLGLYLSYLSKRGRYGYA